MTQHARAAASAAERWLECPGSVLAVDTSMERKDSEYSLDGLHAHSVAEKLLHSGEDAWTLVGTEVEGRPVDQEKADAVQLYLDYVRERVGPDDPLTIETTLKADEFQADDGDTIDAYIVGAGYLHLLDLKYGIGIQKDAKDNPQLLKYAVRLLAKIDKENRRHKIEHVGMTIVQPRGFHVDGPIREHWMAADEVRKWGEEVLKPAMARLEPGQPVVFSAGEHCRFCAVGAALKCPLTMAIFERMTNTVAPPITEEQLGVLKEFIPVAKMQIKWIEEEALRRAEAGKKIPGFKLVAKRAERVWKDGAESELAKMLGNDVYTRPELKSPAQVERMTGGAAFVARLAYKPETGYTLAPDTDNRASVSTQTPDQMWAGVSL